jgi:predicted DNA-binding protein (MmcQ/YjbR family)
MTTKKKSAAKAALIAYALALPDAYEDHPWGEIVAKVAKKVFVFFGVDASDFGFAVKLPESGAAALELPFCEPCGYGLGKAGWVSVKMSAGDELPPEVLREWIVESYRAVAPKKLAKALDAQPDAPAPRASKKAVAKKPAAKRRASPKR